MKQEDTKQRILACALELFSERGYDAVGVGEIAAAVGIRAPSLYNHYPSKRAIFDAIVAETAARYERDTDRIHIHVQDVGRDTPEFAAITEDGLSARLRALFLYSLHDETVRRFRRMMTIEQFRSLELAALYSGRYVDRMVAYHAAMFRSFAAQGVLRAADPEALALLYVSPVITLLGLCDRQPEREPECLARLDAHVRLFFRTYHLSEAE